MKNRRKLLEFFQSELTPALDALEIERKSVVKKVLLIALVLAGVVSWIFFKYSASFAFFWLIFALFTLLAIKIYIAKSYVLNFKKEIIKQIISFIDPTLIYLPLSHVSKQSFAESQIFKRPPDVLKGDDYVSGQIGVTKVEFSELHAQYISKSSRGKKNKVTLFKGLFFSADFNKHFRGKTFVLPDVSERVLGRVGTMIQELNSQHGELVKLEDVEFEKRFVVYADDQIEARYILSPALMERIKGIQTKTNKRIALSFVGSKINIAIPYSKDLFEPTLFRTIKKFKSIADYFEELVMMIELVEDLNLNTRIWTKK